MMFELKMKCGFDPISSVAIALLALPDKFSCFVQWDSSAWLEAAGVAATTVIKTKRTCLNPATFIDAGQPSKELAE